MDPCSSDHRRIFLSLHIGPLAELSVLAYLQPLCTLLVGLHEAFCLEDFRRASKAPRIAGPLRSDKTFPLGDNSQGGTRFAASSSTSVTGFYFLALSWHISFWPPPLACSIIFALHAVLVGVLQCRKRMGMPAVKAAPTSFSSS